jgi:hypothetical protein
LLHILFSASFLQPFVALFYALHQELCHWKDCLEPAKWLQHMLRGCRDQALFCSLQVAMTYTFEHAKEALMVLFCTFEGLFGSMGIII